MGDELVTDTVLRLLPPTIRRIVLRIPQQAAARLEEIRIRAGRPLELIGDGVRAFVSADGELPCPPDKAYVAGKDDCAQLLDLISNHSLYTLEEELRRGYVTVRGGHRVGLAGRAVLERGAVSHLRDIACFNIRIARQRPGCARKLAPLLADAAGTGVLHTLIVSPPGYGKTTIARDLARLLSSGEAWPTQRRGLKVGIVDERSELAGCVDGVPCFDVGPSTDVLDACPKAEGMMMLIRSMSPEVIVVDEIGREADADSIHEAVLCGIRVIATAHGDSWRDIRARPVVQPLLERGVFERVVVLGRRPAGGDPPFAVYDGAGRPLRAETGLAAGGRSP